MCKYDDPVLEARQNEQKEMRQPRIERGAHRVFEWQRWILPLNHWRDYCCILMCAVIASHVYEIALD